MNKDEEYSFGQEYARQYIDHMDQEFAELVNPIEDEFYFWEGFVDQIRKLKMQ